MFHALEVCEDETLKLAMNLAFSCSMRLDEVLGLTWDCVDISEESIAAGTASVHINKELQRVNRETLKLLGKPSLSRKGKSVGSSRKVGGLEKKGVEKRA